MTNHSARPNPAHGPTAPSAGIVIGVDPGKTGAIALLDEHGQLIDAFDMPEIGGKVSPYLLADADNWADNRFGVVIIEDVHAMPKQGVTSAFGFGRSFGVVEGVFAAAGRPCRYVTPAKWKRDLGLTADKHMSRRRAIELWPERAQLFARARDDGRAEAALIAHWWHTTPAVGRT